MDGELSCLLLSIKMIRRLFLLVLLAISRRGSRPSNNKTPHGLSLSLIRRAFTVPDSGSIGVRRQKYACIPLNEREILFETLR